MEVHHKHHIPKKFKEYITEFLMLFTAVTLGFFAENYREHSLVEKKMHENYETLIQDLKSDSTKMATLIDQSAVGKRNLLALNYSLYQYHSGKIGYDQLVGKVKNLEALPSYNTVFINNTTFKNIQSSGMLSYINPRDLRFQVSYYYEVMFKQLQDNNAIFDRDGMEFFDKNLPFGFSLGAPTLKLNKEREEERKTTLDMDYAGTKQHLNFILNLSESKKILQSDQLVYQSEVYYMRFTSYTRLLVKMLDKNKQLLKQLRTLDTE